MIISASYRTDIPAFFGRWFAERWAEGHCDIPNPYNKKLYRVSLAPRDISAMVFWTRAAKPFLDNFQRVHEAGVPFIVTYTVTGYETAVDRGVPPYLHSAEVMHTLAERYGPDCVTWRYDPILFTDTMDANWHLKHFEDLASTISGATNEAIVSFAQFYAKTNRNLKSAGINARDPSSEEKQALLRELSIIAAKHNMGLSLCAQPELLIPEVKNAACIDLQRLWRINGEPFKAKMKPHRPQCGCAESRDIGTFATCKFGCAYCYAK